MLSSAITITQRKLVSWPQEQASRTTSDSSNTKTNKSSATFNDWLELARWWKPAGTVAFYIPLIAGSAVYLVTGQSGSLRLIDFGLLNAQLVAASILQRSSACAWNDAADYKFDRQVARCRNRPIARGAISPTAGRIYAITLAIGWILTCLWNAPQSGSIQWTLIPNFIFHVIYPYMKRITYYPQVFLGFTFSLNVLTGYAMTATYFENLVESPLSRPPQTLQTLVHLMLAEAGYACFYDTIYAYQDLADDEKASVGSPAIVLGTARGKIALTWTAVSEIIFLVLAGYTFQAGTGYYLLTCGGSALLNLLALGYCDLRSPESCGQWFKRCLFHGLWVQVAGFAAEYAQRSTATLVDLASA